MMLFSEVYGSYFRVVASVLTEAAKGCLTDHRMTELVQEKAFAESTLSIPNALRESRWPLLDKSLCPVLRHTPAVPLTDLQRRWLKALLQDPRIALFAPDAAGLEDVRPLYQPDTFVYFDQYTDGDPYGDERYIRNFQTVLQAIREKRKLRVRFRSHTGVRHSFICAPYRLEYSKKDDKFRLLAAGKRNYHTINLARVRSCTIMEKYDLAEYPTEPEHEQELTLLFHDERNALERILLHFSHLEKETRRLDGTRYELKIRYDKEDETELLIRVLSFGPVLEVLSPPDFRDLVKSRIRKQLGQKPFF